MKQCNRGAGDMKAERGQEQPEDYQKLLKECEEDLPRLPPPPRMLRA